MMDLLEAAGIRFPALGRGKSGLQTDSTPGNARPRQREGKCSREKTAPGSRPEVRVKGCGKSAPLLR